MCFGNNWIDGIGKIGLRDPMQDSATDLIA